MLVDEPASVLSIWCEALAIIRRYPLAAVIPTAVLGSVGDAPYYFIKGELTFPEEILTTLTGASLTTCILSTQHVQRKSPPRPNKAPSGSPCSVSHTDVFRFLSAGNKRSRELFLQRRPSVEAPSERTHVLLLPRDLIHRAVTDLYDDRIGYVRDLLIDEADWKVRFLHVTGGGHLGFDEHHFLIPIEAVRRVSAGFVTIEQSRQKVQEAPELDPNILVQPQLRHEIYEYYGYPVPE